MVLLPHGAVGNASAKQLAVIVALAAYDEDGYATLSYGQLGDAAGMSLSTARRTIIELIGGGVITRHRQYEVDGQNGANSYRLNWIKSKRSTPAGGR